MLGTEITLVGTCPTFIHEQGIRGYLDRIAVAGRRAEEHGWSSMLIYTAHKQLDPWVIANVLLGATRELTPLVALQPLYMHPFSAAKMVASLHLLHGRQININFVSGGFPRDLEAFCDRHSHDERYARAVEYGNIMQHLLTDKKPLTFNGQFYNVESLQLQPWVPVESDCVGMFTISGSSPAGLAAARKLGARAIQYLRPYGDYGSSALAPTLQYGTRVGIISRPTVDQAWEVANTRFPANEVGAQLRNYFVSVSDSVWVAELGREIKVPEGHPYWLGPYKHNYAQCPYLVGDRSAVAAELAGYIRMGLRTFLVDEPQDDDDALNITETFALAQQMAVQSLSA